MHARRVGVCTDDVAAGIDAEHLRTDRALGLQAPKLPTFRAQEATWVHSHDGSSVWAKLHTNGAAVVDQNAIAWLLLDAVGVQDGPTGGDILTKTTFVQRVNTTGGLAPKSGCGSPGDLGNQAFIPYTADYFFYTKD